MVADVDVHAQLLSQIAASVSELLALARLMSYPVAKQALESALDTEDKRRVYQLLDGTRSMDSIHRLTGLSKGHMSEWGQEWERLGIVQASSTSRVKGRRQRVFDLSTYGIPAPSPAGGAAMDTGEDTADGAD